MTYTEQITFKLSEDDKVHLAQLAQSMNLGKGTIARLALQRFLQEEAQKETITTSFNS